LPNRINLIRLEYLNDTQMTKLSLKQQKILALFLKQGVLSSSDIHAELGKTDEKISLVTIKRELSALAADNFLTVGGAGRATNYTISAQGRIFADVSAHDYCAVEPDQRYGLNHYNFDLLPQWPTDIFTAAELKTLEDATAEYQKRTSDLPIAIQTKELERLTIELSWKSSRIEGNTYTLLDTEKLILKNETAVGHDSKETQMILNHKDAFKFVYENSAEFKTLTKQNLEKLHEILVKDLDVATNLRQRIVGVIGSIYQPLDNQFQILEAVEQLGKIIAKMSSPYTKAMTALLGISYIQPFDDGNKRTGRLMANALLLAHQRAPLSYRSVNENDYREAILVFYELNSIIPFKKIFVEQYDFAARNYAVK